MYIPLYLHTIVGSEHYVPQYKDAQAPFSRENRDATPEAPYNSKGDRRGEDKIPPTVVSEERNTMLPVFYRAS